MMSSSKFNSFEHSFPGLDKSDMSKIANMNRGLHLGSPRSAHRVVFRLPQLSKIESFAALINEF